ncbi:MAG: hypothetical protein RLZZ210_1646, partial [Pseudomonadota bacterium]
MNTSSRILIDGVIKGIKNKDI